jgi:dUTP pyrophosphatase
MPRKKESRIAVRVVRLAHGTGLALPAYQSEAAAGLDLVAAVDDAEPLTLAPGERALIPTGLVLELPPGHEAQVRPRSGLALKHGVTVLNSPGTIDSDYRGEVKVLLINLGADPFQVRRGDRIAQLVVASAIMAKLTIADALSRTKRGAGGFGSTVGKEPARKRRPAKSSAARGPSRRKSKP